MAPPVYSTRFIFAHESTGAVDYVVPVGFTAVVRDLDIIIGPTTGGLLGLFVNGAYLWIQQVGVEAGYGDYQWRGRQVAFEEELISVSTDIGADIHLSGYLLTG